MAPNLTERDRPLSAILEDIEADEREYVTVGEMAGRFGGRAFGALLFIFAVPNLLPLPPGSTTILGAPLLLLSPQLAIGLSRPWLPRFVNERPIRRADLARAFAKVLPTLRRIETVSGPRLTWLFGPIGDRVTGLICTALALVLVLPIPLGNVAPSIIIALFGLALVQRDGVLALITTALTLGSAWLMAVGVKAAWALTLHMLGVVGWL